MVQILPNCLVILNGGVHIENLDQAFDHTSTSLPPAILVFCAKNKSEFGELMCVQLDDRFFFSFFLNKTGSIFSFNFKEDVF